MAQIIAIRLTVHHKPYQYTEKSAPIRGSSNNWYLLLFSWWWLWGYRAIYVCFPFGLQVQIY